MIDTDLTSQFKELRAKFWGHVLVVNHWDLQCLLLFQLERIKNNLNKYWYIKMASITLEQFDAQVKELKLDAIKWRELQDGAIYTIVDLKFINIQFGEACILTLGDETKVVAPFALITRLKLDNKPCPLFVRPKGRAQSKRNPNQTYYAFDLV